MTRWIKWNALISTALVNQGNVCVWEMYSPLRWFNTYQLMNNLSQHVMWDLKLKCGINKL